MNQNKFAVAVVICCCMFTLCTTRPIDAGRQQIATHKDAPDKVDMVTMKAEQLEASGESLSNRLNIEIQRLKRRQPELRPAPEEATYCPPGRIKITVVDPHFGEERHIKAQQ